MDTATRLFEGLSFHLDEDVNDEIRVIIQQQGGSFWDEEDHPLLSYKDNCIFLVNQRYWRENKRDPRKPRFYRVVLHQWVNMCLFAGRRVDAEPFLISMPQEELNKRQQLDEQAEVETVNDENATGYPRNRNPGKGKYTKEEEDIMWDFASMHEDLTMQKLWELAEEENLLPGRTARAMLLRYTELKKARRPLDKTFRHYDQPDDHNILVWAYLWHKHGPKDRTLTNMWQAAQENHLVDGRSETQMKARYKRLLKEDPTWQDTASRLVSTQRWLPVFNSFNEVVPLDESQI